MTHVWIRVATLIGFDALWIRVITLIDLGGAPLQGDAPKSYFDRLQKPSQKLASGSSFGAFSVSPCGVYFVAPLRTRVASLIFL